MKVAVDFLPFHVANHVVVSWGGTMCLALNRGFSPTHFVFITDSMVVSLQRWPPRTMPSGIYAFVWSPPTINDNESDLSPLKNVVKVMLTLKKAWLPSLLGNWGCHIRSPISRRRDYMKKPCRMAKWRAEALKYMRKEKDTVILAFPRILQY